MLKTQDLARKILTLMQESAVPTQVKEASKDPKDIEMAKKGRYPVIRKDGTKVYVSVPPSNNESADPAHVAAVRELEREVEYARQAAISASFMGGDRSAAAIAKWNALERKLEAAVQKLSLHEDTAAQDAAVVKLLKKGWKETHRDEDTVYLAKKVGTGTTHYCEVDETGRLAGYMGEAFGPTPNHPILPAVKSLVDQINDFLDQAQDIRIAREVSKHKFDWQQGMSDEAATERLAQFKHRLRIVAKQKYINLDRVDANGGGASGLYMVDTSDGSIYGVKAYGTPNKIRRYGTVDHPKLGDLLMVAAVLERPEMQELLAKHGIRAY